MGVQLNIKDAECAELARGLARELGTTVTTVVREALLEKSQRHKDEVAERIRKVNEIVDEVQKMMPAEWRGKSSKEIMDSIYDDEQPDGFAR